MTVRYIYIYPIVPYASAFLHSSCYRLYSYKKLCINVIFICLFEENILLKLSVGLNISHILFLIEPWIICCLSSFIRSLIFLFIFSTSVHSFFSSFKIFIFFTFLSFLFTFVIFLFKTRHLLLYIFIYYSFFVALYVSYYFDYLLCSCPSLLLYLSFQLLITFSGHI